jgi:hypothetical protein
MPVSVPVSVPVPKPASELSQTLTLSGRNAHDVAGKLPKCRPWQRTLAFPFPFLFPRQ